MIYLKLSWLFWTLFSIFSFNCCIEVNMKPSLQVQRLKSSPRLQQVVQHSCASHGVLPFFQLEQLQRQGSKPSLTPLKIEINPAFKIMLTGSTTAGRTRLWAPPLRQAKSTTSRRNGPSLTLTSHRLLEWFRLGGNLKSRLVPTHCRGQGHLPLDQVAQLVASLTVF